MKNATVKIVGLKYIDCVDTAKAEDFLREVIAGNYGEAEIVDFHVTRDTETEAYREQNLLINMMRHLYNTYQTHAVYCRECDTWKFGRSKHIFQSPCEDHERIEMSIDGQYSTKEALAMLRVVRDKFASHTNGEHKFEIYMPDDYYSTNENLAVLQFFYPEDDQQLNDMVCWVADNCPELHFKMESSAFVEVTNSK